MSLPRETLESLKSFGAKVDILAPGLSKKGGEAEFFEKDGQVLIFVTDFKTCLRDASYPPIESTVFVFLPEDFQCLGPSSEQVGGPDHFFAKKGKEVIVIYPNGPDPRAVEFEEEERERKAKIHHYDPAS